MALITDQRETADRPAYAGMIQQGADAFRVSTRIYTDPAVFEDELRLIFARTWVYLGHETEIAQPGDYRTGYIGRQPIILSRAEDGSVHGLLNACRHRGNVVCREERGNSSYLRCAYHGWVYANTGKLVGIAERNGYSGAFGSDLEGLVELPKLAVYRGLIFGSLNQDVEDLVGYLGEAKEYVDLWVDRSPRGNVRVTRPHRFVYPGNWKYQAENGADGYHGRYVHESAFKTASHFQGVEARKERNVSVHGVGSMMGFSHGHCSLERPGSRGELPAALLEGYHRDLQVRHGPERTDRITSVRHTLIFPNLYLMDDNIRVIRPIAVDRTEVLSYFTHFDDGSDAINKARLKNLQWRLGTAGLIGTDDAEMFAGCQSGMQAASMGTIDLSRGLHREVIEPSGAHVGESSDEAPQRAIYREWARLMSAGSSTESRQ